jgi:hypothetical protein
LRASGRSMITVVTGPSFSTLTAIAPLRVKKISPQRQ